MDECLFFLNDSIAELQYGGVVEYFMEEVRKSVDDQLNKMGEEVKSETTSMFINLSSNNAADWPKAAHSCRRLLKVIADRLFPPISEAYKMKDGSELVVDDQKYLNRLYAFIDQNLSGDSRRLLSVELKYLCDYLREIHDFANTGEHGDIQKLDAQLVAVHTYLIISELLKLANLQKENKEKMES